MSSKYLALVGRVKTYLEQPELGTLPVSCTILVPKFSGKGLESLIRYVSHALRTGAGINVHLDNFDPQKVYSEDSSIGFQLNPDHPEFAPKVSYQGWAVDLRTQADPDAIKVSDSMTEAGQSWYSDVEGIDSIEDSLYMAYVCGLYDLDITFDLSALRPEGAENQVGMYSSGAVSFAFMLARAYEFGKYQTIESLLAFLSSFNAVLRRGGRYKNGAITTSLPIWHPLAKAYLKTPKEIYPWLKQGLVLPQDFSKWAELLPLVYSKVNLGGLWLEKAIIQVPNETNFEWLESTDSRLGGRLRANVCLKGNQRVVYQNEQGHITNPTIAELANYPAYFGKVFNGSKWVPANFKSYGFASEFYKVETEDGTILEATKDHRWILEDNSERQSHELKVGMSLLTGSQPQAPQTDTSSLDYLHGYTAGFVAGDGHLVYESRANLRIHEPKKCCIPKLQQALKAQLLSDEVKPIANTGHNEKPIWFLPGIGHCKTLAKYAQEYRQNINPEFYQNSNLAFGFITGLFDADGTFQTAPKNKAIGTYSLTSVKLGFLRQLKELLHVYGIESKVLPHTEAGTKDWGKRGGISNHQEAHRILFNCQNSHKLALLCDFQRLPKPESAGNTPRPKLKANRIKSISVEHTEMPIQVYSGQIEGEQYLLSNGFITGNCREVQIRDKSTCNLGHLNAGQISQFSELPEALSLVMRTMCDLHAQAPQDASGFYRPASEDRQVGIGIIGWANLLAHHKIKYREFVVALDRLLNVLGHRNIWKASKGQLELPELPKLTHAEQLAWWLIKAYTEAARVAYSYNMERAFVIAPTSNSSFRYEDLGYWTTSPEISPPLATSIERVSDTQTESDIFFYHPDSETAHEVGWHWYRELNRCWQELMNATGLGHSISFNVWQDIDYKFLIWWANSALVTTYYRLNTDLSSLNKSDQFEPVGGAIKCACAG